MKSIEVRRKFIDFFKSNTHSFTPSSPIVVANDPTLLFVNAGMNQFKDIFLDAANPTHSRVVNSQKCLRVSGKHNDLEEVGHDTYHHTMFEMLGNWSFGDYFKKEAIQFAWNFLTKELKLSEDRLYVTFFAGDLEDKLEQDIETKNIWSKIIASDKIISGSKNDNFWEMGKIGPCGPSTEIHIDLRSDDERTQQSASSLINKDHPQVIELWNIVFIEFNRKEDSTLESLPNKHVDTGMGFERLCMVLQGKTSTYDTDLFQDLIQNISLISGFDYGKNNDVDIAMRVIVDHIRAISFCVADGQLPSNNGAGYVIRRILRRAVRYGYTYLNLHTPFLYQLVDALADQFQGVFVEISNQKSIIKNIIEEEEKVFLHTLGNGLNLINQLISNLDSNSNLIHGSDVFALYDTYGFPPDLTSLILQEKGLHYDQKQFDQCMQEQKQRSRAASEIILGDWIKVTDVPIEGFVGHELFSVIDAKLIKYRKVKIKGESKFHLVFNKTPFYPEGGGQVGDQGLLILGVDTSSSISIKIIDTKKENNLILHFVENFDCNKQHFLNPFELRIDAEKRKLITRNHSATHLLHHTLRSCLGAHVEQKGSYVGSNYLRFDFSHFKKLDHIILSELEDKINHAIIMGIDLEEFRDVSIKDAQEMGAIGLFGEKYGDYVRVIKFQDSIELCGGTHVSNTTEIGVFKILSESSVASGIRRIEAVTSLCAIHFFQNKLHELEGLQLLLKSSDNIIDSVKRLMSENKQLHDLTKSSQKQKLDDVIKKLESEIIEVNNIKLITKELSLDVSMIKNICFSFIKRYDNILVALATKSKGKSVLNIALSKSLVELKNLNASQIINNVSTHINGKGGGQAFFSVASGDIPENFDPVFEEINDIIKSC
ncbi:MAG: alanine--tRNA ligase [Flavobacteriales bacterium]|nr:alanine--tRNA ligase [Flavobacteriales bacterium]